VACREDMRNAFCTQSLSENLMKRDRLGDLGLHSRQGFVGVKLLRDKTQGQDTGTRHRFVSFYSSTCA